VQQFIASYGYLAIFVLMVAESACIPVPSEVTMVFGGALAAGAVAGTQLNLALVIAAGVAGNVAGSYIAWGVGAYGGRAAWRRWGRYVLLRPGDIDRADRWFGRHGTKAVFFGRLLPVVRTFISLPAGIARMSPARFGIYTLAGCIPWTAALAWAGYAVGANWQHVVSAFHGVTYALIAVIVLLVVIGFGLLVRRRIRDHAQDDGRDHAKDDSREPDLASDHNRR
jgi:membrane protein DedA with SNARE-associated domain